MHKFKFRPVFLIFMLMAGLFGFVFIRFTGTTLFDTRVTSTVTSDGYTEINNSMYVHEVSYVIGGEEYLSTVETEKAYNHGDSITVYASYSNPNECYINTFPAPIGILAGMCFLSLALLLFIESFIYYDPVVRKEQNYV